jgi:hypothetical protein
MWSSVYPKGDHMALARLSLAAICRTILPLAILLVMEYTTAFSVGDCVIPIVLGFLLTMAVSTGFAVRRHHQTDHDPDGRQPPRRHPRMEAGAEDQSAPDSMPQRVDVSSSGGNSANEMDVERSTSSPQVSRSRI